MGNGRWKIGNVLSESPNNPEALSWKLAAGSGKLIQNLNPDPA
jgi:hypothetical protein